MKILLVGKILVQKAQTKKVLWGHWGREWKYLRYRMWFLCSPCLFLLLDGREWKEEEQEEEQEEDEGEVNEGKW